MKKKRNKHKFELMNRMKRSLGWFISNISELFFVFGFIFIIKASFLINKVVGFYVLGFVLCGIASVLLALPERKVK